MNHCVTSGVTPRPEGAEVTARKSIDVEIDLDRDRPTTHTHTRTPHVEMNSSEVLLTEGCGIMSRTAIQVSGVSKVTLLPTARGRGDELRGARRFRYQKSAFGYLEP